MRPVLMTTAMSSRLAGSLSGSPPIISRSANLPLSTVPSASSRLEASAAFLVTMVKISSLENCACSALSSWRSASRGGSAVPVPKP